ncbi:MAG: hypothetical protein WAR83_03620 [Flavobacteriales bacterium]
MICGAQHLRSRHYSGTGSKINEVLGSCFTTTWLLANRRVVCGTEDIPQARGTGGGSSSTTRSISLCVGLKHGTWQRRSISGEMLAEKIYSGRSLEQMVNAADQISVALSLTNARVMYGLIEF